MKVYSQPCPIAQREIGNAVLEVRKFAKGGKLLVCECCGRNSNETPMYETGVYKLPSYIGIQGNTLCEDCINFIYDFYFTEEKPKKIVAKKATKKKVVNKV